MAAPLETLLDEALMAAGELTRPDGDFQRIPFPEMLAGYAGHVNDISGRKALVALLRDSHAEGERKFREAGELMLLQTIRRFDGIRGTRFAWLNHMIDHESYHRGQLALYVRMLGQVPALTRLIHGG